MKVLTHKVSEPEGAPPGPPEHDPLLSLLAGARAGDPVELQKVLKAVGPGVVAVVRGVLGREHPDVPDVTQESLIAFRDALKAFRGESSLVHYARRIALRVAISAQRRTLRRRSLEEAKTEDAEPRPWGDDEDPAVRERRLRALRDLLGTLPAAQSESLAQRVILGHSLDQIAQDTGVPVNTVRSRVRLALEAVRRRISRDPALREILGGEA